MIFVNFKTYEEASGQKAIELVKIIQEVSEETQIKIIPVLQALDIKEAVTNSKLEIWTQKIDPVTYGAHTGAILAEGVFEDGAMGTFLNHSEAKINEFEDLRKAVSHAREVGLKTLVFAIDINELTLILDLKPDFVAYEPPDLVGSTKVSVTTSLPNVISEAAIITKKAGIPLIVGAGIHSRDDVKKSLELGATGIAVATNIVKAQNPKEALLNLVEGFK